MLQSGLNENWWADSMEFYTYLRNVTDLFSDGKTPYERRFGQPLWRTDYSMWFIGWVSPKNCERPVKDPSICKESLTWIVPRIRIVRGGNLEGWRTGCRPWRVGDDGRIGNLLEKTQWELWKRMGKNAKLKEKQKWSNEKLHLDNARNLRGVYFIDPEDTEFKETIKNARKKLETPVAPAMPCKIMKKNCGSGASNKIETRFACILESLWIYKTAYGRVITKSPWRPNCRKRKQFTTALWFGTQICSYASSYENSRSKSCGGQGMGKIGEIFGVEPDKSQKQERSDRWSKDEGRKSSFRLTDGHMSFEKISELETKHQKVQRSSCAPRWYCRRRFGGLCSVHRSRNHQHLKWQPQKSWISFPDCLVATDKQRTQYLLIPG